VRILGQPQPAVLQERLGQRRLMTHPRLGDPPALEVGADGLAVMAQMPGDRRDRPALLARSTPTSVRDHDQHG
jgi:hypothetical protein